MININLVIRPAPLISWRRVMAIVGAMAVLGGCAWYGLIWWTAYQQLAGDQAQAAALAESYRQLLGREKELAAAESALAERWAWFAEMGRNQAPRGQSSVLAALFQAAGYEVQLQKITFLQGRELSLTGQAPTFAAAAQYLERLRRVPQLGWVRERKVETGPAGVTLFTFQAGVGAE